MKTSKKQALFYTFLLFAAIFDVHKIHTMEPDPQQRLFDLCDASVITTETLIEIESLCKRADVNLDFIYQYESREVTLLMAAVIQNNCPLIKILLKYGANINATDSHGLTALMMAAFKGHTDAVLCLLNDPHIMINQSDNDGETALITAAQQNHCSLINIFLEYGANINAVDSDGNTALMFAIVLGKIDAVQCFLSNKNIIINQQNYVGNTALLLALISKNALPIKRQLIQQLIAAGADARLANNQGVTPWQVAQYLGDPEILRLIHMAIQSELIEIEEGKKTGGAA